jgi:hypothetical protein
MTGLKTRGIHELQDAVLRMLEALRVEYNWLISGGEGPNYIGMDA